MKHWTPKYCYGLLIVSICHNGKTLSNCTWWASKKSRTKVMNFAKYYDETHHNDVASTVYYICDPDTNKWCIVNNKVEVQYE